MVLLCSCSDKKILVKQDVKIKPVETFRILSISPQGKVCIDDEKNRFIKIRFSQAVDQTSVNNRIQVKERWDNGSLHPICFGEQVQKDAKELVVTLWEVPILYPCQLIISPGIKSQTGLSLSDTTDGQQKNVAIRYYTNDKDIGNASVISFLGDYEEPEFDPKEMAKTKAAAETIATLDKLQKQLSEMKEKTSEFKKGSKK